MPFSRPTVFIKPGVPSVQEEPSVDISVEMPSETFRDEMPLMVDLAPVPEEVQVTMILKVTQTTYNDYQKVAAAQGQSVADVMQHRLEACKSHNALRGLWFSDSERKQLEELIQKRPLENATQVLSKLSVGGMVKLEGPDGENIELTLSPAQKRVLKLAMYGGRTYKSFLEAMIKKELRV